MIVYIESNFILQLALQQEEAEEASAILKLAQNRDIELAFPTFAISEPFSTIAYHAVERRRVYEMMLRQLTQLLRSALHQQIVSTLQSLLTTWVQIDEDEITSLQATVQTLLIVGRSIETTASIFERASDYQTAYDLPPQDSIIYSTIIADLQRISPDEPKCFVSTNIKDFRYPSIKSELQTYGCRYIAKFADAVQFINSVISHDPQS
jgi:predicted nucleic acid-binding protein